MSDMKRLHFIYAYVLFVRDVANIIVFTDCSWNSASSDEVDRPMLLSYFIVCLCSAFGSHSKLHLGSHNNVNRMFWNRDVI